MVLTAYLEILYLSGIHLVTLKELKIKLNAFFAKTYETHKY